MRRSKINRRDFLSATATLAAAACLKAARALSQAAQKSSYAYVGTYTPNGGGIYLFRVDASSGALTQLQVADDIRNPTWLALNGEHTRLYAVSEIDNFDGTRNGAVATYAIDPDSSQLQRLGVVSSEGSAPSHVSVHPSGKFAFVANYGGGNVAVFPVGADGVLAGASDVRPSVGPRHHPRAIDDPPGQFAVSDHDNPHPRMVAADPSGQFVIANDAGLDLTLVWKLDMQAGRLLPADVPILDAPSGSAPRHFVFHPNGRTFYNLYEHDAKIAVYDYDAHGGFKLKQSLSTLPAKFAGSTLSSAIVITPDGRYLYAANRLHNAVVAFAIAPDGELHSLAENWTHSDGSRSISIDPTGAFLFSCNQRGDSITSFRINGNGNLSFTGRFEAVGSPTAMIFIGSS